MGASADTSSTGLHDAALRVAGAGLASSEVSSIQTPNPSCAVLADRHTVLAEGIRALLETAFETVYLVADIESLREGARRLEPGLIVIDLSFAGAGFPDLLRRIRKHSPGTHVIVLSVHDEAAAAEQALAAGAEGVVLKRCAGRDFMLAVDAVLSGGRFVSPDFAAVA